MRLWLCKTTTLFLVGFGICSVMGIASHAQTSPSGAVPSQSRRRKLPSLEDQLKRLTDVLELDSLQQAKVKTILDRRQIQLHRVHDDQSLSAVDRFNAILAVHEHSDDQIASILSAEQAKKFEQVRPHKTPLPEGQTLTIPPNH